MLLGEATGIDFERRILRLRDGELPFDDLLLATGGQTSYFGHDEWSKFAPGLKSLDDAIEIRCRVLLAFEAAEREGDTTRQRELLRFVVVGGGPTGVELAGAIAELARHVLARDFRSINPQSAEILLLEGGPRILRTFAPDLSASATRQLAKLGVTTRVNAQVTRIDERGVWLGDELVASTTVLWGAGVRATPFTERLGVPLDRAGRVLVEPDLSLPGHAHVFAIGDMAYFSHQDGQPLPGISPVAMQMGRHVARNIEHDLRGQPREPFRYVDKGTMATIGRKAAIVQLGRWKFSGFAAWVTWLVVHIYFLIGFRNRLVVLFNWAWSYFTYQRGARLITGSVSRPAARREYQGPDTERVE